MQIGRVLREITNTNPQPTFRLVPRPCPRASPSRFGSESIRTPSCIRQCVSVVSNGSRWVSSQATSTSSSSTLVVEKKAKPKNYWKSLENQRAFLLELGKSLGFSVTSPEDWYKLTKADIVNGGGGSMYRSHDYSILKMLSLTFPEHEWDPLRFSNKPRNFWASSKNQRALLDEIGLKLGIFPGNFDPWYKVRKADLLRLGGGSLAAKFNNSPIQLLREVYPEHNWDPSKLPKKQQGFWLLQENIRKEVISIGTKLGIKEGRYEPWYRVQYKDLLRLGASRLLSYHNSSVSDLLRTAFPEFAWDQSRFNTKGHSYWESITNQRDFLHGLLAKRGLPSEGLDSFYNLTSKEVIENGGSALLQKHHKGSLMSLVSGAFPEKEWDALKFKGQRTHFPNISGDLSELA